MTRQILDEAFIDPAIRGQVSALHADIVAQVQAAVAANRVVVVGMAQNPFPKRARRALAAAQIAHEYLEFGSYFSQWRARNALKMWTGWPTFPMVFVDGVLMGGASELVAQITSGALQKRLASARA